MVDFHVVPNRGIILRTQFLFIFALSFCVFSFSNSVHAENLDFDDLSYEDAPLEDVEKIDESSRETSSSLFEKNFPKKDGESWSDARRRFKIWSNQVRPAYGLTPSDLVSESNPEDLQALLNILQDLQRSEPAQNKDSGFQVRGHEFHKNLLHTQGNLEEKGRDLVQVSILEWSALRVQGWGDHQSDRDDVLLVRDFLLRLQGSLESDPFSRPIHARIKDKILALVRAAMTPLGSSLDDVKRQALLKSWAALSHAKTSEINDEFPWEDVAHGRHSLGAIDTAFEIGNTVLTYLEFSRTRIHSCALILAFANHSEVLTRLQDLRDFSQKVDLRLVESRFSERSGPLWVFQMVRSLRGNPDFRGLAKKLFQTHKTWIDQPEELQKYLDFLKARLDAVWNDSSTSKSVDEAKQSQSESLMREFSLSSQLAKKLAPLVKIASVPGMSFPEAEIQGFETEAGLQFKDWVETQGNPGRIEVLLRESFAREIRNPRAMMAKIQALETANERLSSMESIPKLMEEAGKKNVNLALEKRKDLNQYFSFNQGRLVFKPASLKWIKEGDSSSSVVFANQDFGLALGKAELQLRSVEDVAGALESALSEAEFLSHELASLGESQSATESSNALDRVRQISDSLRKLSGEVRSDFKAMSSLQDGFRLSRSRLLDLLGLDPGLQLSQNGDQLSEAVQRFFKQVAFQEEELTPRVSRLFKLLHGVHRSARAIHALAENIEERTSRVHELRATLIEIQGESSKRLPKARKERERLAESHRLRYQEVNYPTENELELLAQSAPMQARIDGSWASHFAARYLTGYIRKGDTASNHIEKITVKLLSGNRIEVGLSLAHIEVDEEFKEVYRRKEITLQVIPKVIKSKPNNFDFILNSLKVQAEGEAVVELKTDLGIVLDSTILVMNQLVESLNNTPYKDLRFKYFPHLSTLRVANAIPLFQSFPNFTVSHIKLDESGILLYGGILGKKLGQFLGEKIHLSSGTGVKSKSPEGSNSQKTSDSVEMEEFLRQPLKESLEPGKVTLRVRQNLIGDFYDGFRKGFLVHNRGLLNDTSLKGRTRSFFNGLQEFHLRFSDQSLVDAWFKGNFQTISKETSDFYFKAMKIIAPVEGFRKGVMTGTRNVVRFLTFGAVEIEVDPNNFRPPSGAFALYLRGKSSASDQQLRLSFDQISLYDPKAPGALQPYVKLVHTAAGAVRLVGKVGDGLKKALNLLPGVEFELSGNNLDEALLNYMTYFLVAEIRQSVPDLDLVPHTYKSYELGIKDFSLVEGMKASIQEIHVKPEFLEIEAVIGQ
jgi:hypothetical protein